MTGVHPSWKVSPQQAPGPMLGAAVPFRVLAHLVPSSSSLEDWIIPGLTSLPPSLQSPRAAAAAATALAQLPSSPRVASSKAAFPNSDLWEPRTAQVMATGLWSAWGSLGRALSRKGLRISLYIPGDFSCSEAGLQITSHAWHRPAVPSLNLSPTQRPLGGHRSFVYC